MHYVLLVLDLTSRASWDALKANLKALDPVYLHGRASVVATHVDTPHACSVLADELDALVDFYDISCLFANLSAPRDTSVLAERVMTLCRMACGYCGTATPTLLRTLEYEKVCSTAY